MAAPSFTIKQNASDSHQTAPGWVAAFVRFKHPATGYTTKSNILETKPLMIVENDCIGVDIDNPKAGFAKTCNLTMKTGELSYSRAVSPGDWVCVWIHDEQSHVNEIVKNLRQLKSGKAEDPSVFNDWESGLKFIGRVIGVSSSESISGGVKSTTQTVHCQAFLELATSVYFTEFARFAGSAGLTAKAQSADFVGNANLSYALNRDRFKGVANKFLDALQQSADDPNKSLTPDRFIEYLIILLFGIDKNDFNEVGASMRGNFNDAIPVPSTISTITGNGSNKKLWQYYNFVLGLQRYGQGSTTASSFFPRNATRRNNFYFTPERCKGWIWHHPPVWDNKTFWEMFNQYLNPALNEIYTCLRIDSSGRIRPTVVVREKPFSTGLYNAMWSGINMSTIEPVNKNSKKVTTKQQSKAKKDEKTFEKAKGGDKPGKVARSFYCELPRWVIDDSMLMSLSLNTNEGNRINFVQVFGKNILTEMAMTPQAQQNAGDAWRQDQFIQQNYVSDDQDIARNGLRLSITNTEFDRPASSLGAGSATTIWARMRADWLFNGHLKPEGSISLVGVHYPICEGDNAEIRGVVYHIERVSHSARLERSGAKTFTTTLQVSNGILASSLQNPDQLPAYPSHLSPYTVDDENAPGVSDYQLTSDPARVDGTKDTGGKGGDE